MIQEIRGLRLRTGVLVGLIVCAAAMVALYELGAFARVINIPLFRDLFQSVVWEGLPFIVLGVVLSAMIEAWVKPAHLAGLLGDTLIGRLAAGLLGIFVPVCDCGAVPIARALQRKGVKESVAFTFALSSPTVNLMTLIATYFAFHREWTWLLVRGGAGLSIALLVGLLVRFREDGLMEKVSANVVLEDSAVKGAARWRSIITHAQNELFSVGPFFAASALLASIVQGLTPLQSVTTFTHDSFWSIPVLMVLGALLSLCSSADAFVAVGLSTLFSPGAILAFLLAGQMVDLRNLALMPQVFSRRTVLLGLSVAVIAIVGIALLVNTVLGSWFM